VGCGDGRDTAFLQRVIGAGARVDAAFLDPPYNVRIGGHAVAAGSHREFAMASGEMSEVEFRTFLTDTLGAAVGVSREGAVHFVCMDWRHMDSLSTVGDALYGERLNLCIWNKSNAGMGSLYRSKHELVFVYRVGKHTMTEVERTSAGLQTVIPGCERRALPKSTTRVDDNGQGLLTFYKPSSLREQLAKRADALLLPKRGQRALASGLFVS
jgi:hypothetical protein